MKAIIIAQLISLGIQMGATVTTLTLQLKLMLDLVNEDWLLMQARQWGFYFDQYMMKYANDIYQYFIQLLNGTLFNKDIIDGIMTRLYVIVGIFIFFKLAATAIKYIVAPEQFLDAKTGGQALIKRIILGTVIIIALPLAFDIAMSIQSAIIEDNVIAKIIMPSDAYKKMTADSKNTGRNIAMTVFLGFFSWNDSIDPSAKQTLYNRYDKVVTYYDISSFKKSDMKAKSNGEYYISYVPIISTLAVGYVLLSLVRYAIEVALRSIKLSFLQIIAPFSIVRWMLNPADDDSLKKWLNTTISTYLIIFIRVMSLWIMVMMAYYLKNGVPTGSDGTVSLITLDSDSVLKAIIVVAMFAFLKELPKLISDLFGYNLQENETVDGVLKQATGAIKGVAMGRVGMGMTAPTMISSGIGSVAGATSATLGGVGSGVQSVGKDANFGTKAFAGFKGALESTPKGLDSAISGMSSQVSGMIGTNMGSSVIGPLSRNTYGSPIESHVVEAPPNQDQKPDPKKDAEDAGKEGGRKAAHSTTDNSQQNQQQPLPEPTAPPITPIQSPQSQPEINIGDPTVRAGFVNYIQTTLGSSVTENMINQAIDQVAGNNTIITSTEQRKIVEYLGGKSDTPLYQPPTPTPVEQTPTPPTPVEQTPTPPTPVQPMQSSNDTTPPLEPVRRD